MLGKQNQPNAKVDIKSSGSGAILEESKLLNDASHDDNRQVSEASSTEDFDLVAEESLANKVIARPTIASTEID